MPELPEVETIKRDLEEKILNKRILAVKVWDTRVIRNCTSSQFIRRITGQTVLAVARKGKAIFCSLSGGWFLTVQPMMSGQLIYHERFVPEEKLKSTKITFKLSEACYLNYNDHRLFGRINAVKDLSELKFFQTIGPDPLESAFTPEWLKERLLKHKAPIKSLLMNQQFVAGIGNIYASEILFRSRISPLRAGCSLRRAEVLLLYQSTVDVLNEAICLRGSSMNTYRDVNNEKGGFMNRVQVYGREDEQCLHCGNFIRRIIQAGRSTFFCRRCQS